MTELIRTTNVSAAVLAAIFENCGTAFAKGFESYEAFYKKLCMELPSASKKETIAWLGLFPNLVEWIGEREMENLGVYAYELEAVKYAKGIPIKRTDIADDQISLFGPMMEEFGRAAAAHPDYLLAAVMAAGWAAACYDGSYFFATDHAYTTMAGAASTQANTDGGASTAWYLLDLSRRVRPFIFLNREPLSFTEMNQPTDESVFMKDEWRVGAQARYALGYGLYQTAWASKQTLNATYYAAGRVGLASMKDDKGRSVLARGTHLVVPPSLEAAGRALLINERDAAGASNPWFNTAELVVNPYL